MKSSRSQSAGHVLLASLVLGLILIGLFLWVVCSYASLTPEEQAKLRYEELMAEEVFTIGDLADVWACEAWSYIQVAIPGATCWTQTKGPLPFDPSAFPKDFLDNLIGYLEGESEVPVYEVTIYQDRLNRDICFLNSDYKLIYVMECPYGDDCNADAFALERFPDLYSGKYTEKEIEEIVAHLDPARVLLRVQMIPSDRLYDYLLDQAKGSGGGDEKEEGEGEGAKTGGGSNDLWVGIEGPAAGLTNIEISAHLPDGFTNKIEIFTCTNLLDFWWTLAATNLSAEGTNVIYWTYDPWANESPVFFALGNADVDSDADGIVDAREKFVYHTDPGLWDTDGDGFSDGDEVYTYGTDPLDKYSVPPLEMLSVSGKYLVDESTNPVVIRSVNIGAWLQWEQWMLMFEPHLWTNDWGRVYGLKTLGADDETDEAAAREMLIDNVDAGAAVTLRATQYSASYGVEVQNWYWIGDDQVTFIGKYTNSSWLCFSNVNFGAGFTNLALGLAVPQENAGNRIEVRLDSPGGTLVGVVTTRVTAGWSDFTEQYLSGFSISGTQTIYFVGSATSGVAIANLYRFRFFGDSPNTLDLFETFRDNYFATNDLDAIKALGYNCIRLPFFHTILEDDNNPYVYKTSGWARLDWALDECAKRRLWVILDLHSTPGGQNTYHASGFADPFKNRLWKSDEYKDRLAALWVEIAMRYSNNPAVAGYDLFNEPTPPRAGDTHHDYRVAYSNYVIPLVTRLHSAIRSNDARHVLFLESNFMYTNMWDDIWSCPAPAAQGWTNAAHQFHVYDQVGYGQNTNDDWWFSTQKGICDSMIRAFTRLSDARQVPVYVGEFAPWDERNIEYWIRQCEANDLHWGHWNYRSWGWDDSTQPAKGRTVWGLDYRTSETTNQMPHLKVDSFATLADKMAAYNPANYTANTHLQEVVQNHTLSTNPASERTEFYLNTFDGLNALTLSDPNAWSWKKVATVGNPNKFLVQDSRARAVLDAGPLLMRFKSRDEADARFAVGDAEGASFSVDVSRFSAASNIAGADAELRLSAVRDEITSPAQAYDTVGIVARLAYEVSGNSATFYLHAKNGGTNTFGTELYQSGPIVFATNATLQISVNQTNASIAYSNTTLWAGAHGLSLGSWPNGAVAVVEAERTAGSGVDYVDMDNFKAWRETARSGVGLTNTFTSCPDGIPLLAEPEELTVRECFAKSWWSESLVTNGEALWIPEEATNGGSWFNPRLDYQNDVRLDVPLTNVVELRVVYNQFRSTNFYAKICFMPEFFPGEIFSIYNGTLPYLEIKYRESGAQAGKLAFDIWRHTGPGTRSWVACNDTNAFVPGRVVSYHMSTNQCRVYYGTNLLINTAHGVTVTNTYRVGAFPHLEFQNRAESTNVTAWVGSVLCRQLPTWAAPEE